MSQNKEWDVIVMGAGPAGCCAASYLLKQGLSVAIFERQTFPRHQIGESLLPGSMPILDELGLMPELEKACFIRKDGATFYSEKTGGLRHFQFSRAQAPWSYALQVSRDRFDTLLLEHARSLGATVFQPEEVCRIEKDGSGIRLNGKYHCQALVRANGVGNAQLLQDNYIENAPEDQVTALYAYYKADFTHQEPFGNILVNIFYPPAGAGDDAKPLWAWGIPLALDLASVGFVINSSVAKDILGAKRNIAEAGRALLAQNSHIKKYLKGGDPVGPYQMRHNFQRVARKIVFDREVLVGDAAGFIDPVFSTGVHLGLKHARDAALTLGRQFQSGGGLARENLLDLEDRYRQLFWSYYCVVKAFYQRNIVENIFLKVEADSEEFQQKINLFTTILAGDIESPNPLLASVMRSKIRVNPEVAAHFHSLQNIQKEAPNL